MVPPEHGWDVAWNAGVGVKWVRILDRRSGLSGVGTDWASWDVAKRKAVAALLDRLIAEPDAGPSAH